MRQGGRRSFPNQVNPKNIFIFRRNGNPGKDPCVSVGKAPAGVCDGFLVLEKALYFDDMQATPKHHS